MNDQESQDMSTYSDSSEWHFKLDLNATQLLTVEKPAYSSSMKNFRQKACGELLSLLENISGSEFYAKKNIFGINPEQYRRIQLLIDKKIIKDFPVQFPQFSDEIKLFNVASCPIYQSRDLTDGDIDKTLPGGSDGDVRMAIFKAAMEGFERYCFQVYRNKNLVRASYSQLRDRGALDPKSVLGYLDGNISDSDFFYWVNGGSYLTGKNCFIPAQLIFWNYLPKEEPGLRPSISTGCAAGDSVEETLYRGLCETIERDAFMIHWLKKITPPRIDLAGIKDEKIQKILELGKRYHLDIFALDITTDLNVPVVSVVIVDRTSLGPAVTVGASCDLNVYNALHKAINEAFFVRLLTKMYWMENKKLCDNLILEEYFNFKKPLLQSSRTLFWSRQETKKYIEFFVRGTHIPLRRNEFSHLSIKQKLSHLVEVLRKKRYDILCYNPLEHLSFGRELQRKNFFALRVIVPQLQPLFLHDNYPCLRGKRLEEVPAALGQPQAKDFFYHIPHPFT